METKLYSEFPYLVYQQIDEKQLTAYSAVGVMHDRRDIYLIKSIPWTKLNTDKGTKNVSPDLYDKVKSIVDSVHCQAYKTVTELCKLEKKLKLDYVACYDDLCAFACLKEDIDEMAEFRCPERFGFKFETSGIMVIDDVLLTPQWMYNDLPEDKLKEIRHAIIDAKNQIIALIDEANK